MAIRLSCRGRIQLWMSVAVVDVVLDVDDDYVLVVDVVVDEIVLNFV